MTAAYPAAEGLDRRDLRLRGLRDRVAGWFQVHPRDLGALDAPTVEHMVAWLEAELARREEIAVDMRAELSQLRTAMLHWEELASTDELTRVPNRRAAELRLAEEIERAHRHQHPLAVLMVDVDNFKSVNDQHGHPAGDQLLRAVAEQLQHCVRRIDVVARWGGDEFLIICADTDAAGAASVAMKVEHLEFPPPIVVAGTPTTPRLSVGWALAEISDDAETLLRQVDRHLYRAKFARRAQRGGERPAEADDDESSVEAQGG